MTSVYLSVRVVQALELKVIFILISTVAVMDENQVSTRNQRVLYGLKKPFIFLFFSVMTYQIAVNTLEKTK